jgi:predicted transcriptional regulator
VEKTVEKILSAIEKNPGITIRELEVEIRLSRRGDRMEY